MHNFTNMFMKKTQTKRIQSISFDKDRSLKEMSEKMFQIGITSENKEDALFFFSLAAYLQRDYLPALFHRAVILFEIGDYTSAIMDIRHCRSLDYDNELYEKWEKLLNSLIVSAESSDC